MSELVSNCPRCGSKKITFDVRAQYVVGQEHDWVDYYELFCTCRHCDRATIFVVSLSDYDARGTFSRGENSLVAFPRALNPFFKIEGYINLRDNVSVPPPDHVPDDIAAAFKEAATCLTVQCYNAAATMFRLCVDLATRPLLPGADAAGPQPNGKQRRDLGLRVAWLLDNGLLPESFRDIAGCIREDANDGAHVGNLTATDAEDLLDFTTRLLERLYTETTKIELAKERRAARRAPK